MSDLIDRQAVIDAIERHLHGVLDGTHYDEGIAFGYEAAHRHIIDAIHDLPSAQQWIPMEEKHPNDGQRVLVQFIDNSMHVLTFSAVGLTTYITAWMPLPEPWKGEED